MKQIKKKMKKPVLIAILSGVLAVLTVTAILLNTLLLSDDGTDGGNDKVIPEILDGEGIFANSAVAFPQIEEKNIDAIHIYADREYILKRDQLTETGPATGPFILFYEDEETGEFSAFYPDITDADANFEYEDLYAVELNDGYGTIPKITYLCSALGTTYFEERIPISESADQRQRDLSVYGLADEDDPLKIDVEYYDADGSLKKHVITLGDQLITGEGYYYTVDGRNYVYSTNVPNFKYALLDFADFINPRLVAKGLAQDSSFEPYLTPAFNQWKNEVIGDDDDEKGSVVPSDSKLVATAESFKPYIVAEDKYNKYDDGYKKEKKKSVTFDFATYKEGDVTMKLVNALSGKKLGTLESALTFTLPSYTNSISFGEKDSVKYVYSIKSIEAIVTDRADITEVGSSCADAKLVRVAYDLTIDGKAASTETCHGVIDLESDKIPAETVAALRAANVGDLATRVELTLDYTTENAYTRKVEMVITEITGIELALNSTLEVLPETAEIGTVVVYRYYLIVDGVKIEGEGSDAIALTENMEGDAKKLYDALNGRKKGSGLEIKIEAYTASCELVQSFDAYTVTELEYFVQRELIVAFAFEQASKRDPYYGESLYSNKMKGHKYELYALNSSACEAVLRVLGGLETSATSSTGLVGIKTVDIGLTPDLLQKYGLYANEIYMELPRGITNIKYDDVPDDEYLASLDDYTYYSTLGFTLYISDVMVRTDGTLFRYIASDMYDLVAEIDAEKLLFLDESFADFYARRELVLTDISDISSVEFDFFMSDIYGSYKNSLIHTDFYAYQGTVKPYQAFVDAYGEEALAYATKYDYIDIIVTPGANSMDTAISDALADKNANKAEGVSDYTTVSLREFYDGKHYEGDNVGTVNFKEFIETLFYVQYEGNIADLTPDEQKAYIEGGVLLMKMKVALYGGYSSYCYAYEFYRVSDRRVVVKIYKEHMGDGTRIQEVSDFYISTFSFKRIVNAYVTILNKGTVDNEGAVYPEAKAD